ncbi:MAG: CARDB domain-containing protein, partial [Thermoplasmatales archaeon]|nr:CARDB domain-containing protein [Thermoplasmatales archaeon]
VNRINDAIAIKCDEYEKWIIPGGGIDFILSIENNGNNNENDEVSLTVDPLPKGWNASLDNYKPSILGKSKATVTLTVTAPSSAKLDDYTNIYVYAVLERNNTTVASKVLKAVVSLPDLTVKNLTLSKSHPRIGEDITINATIWNIGRVDAFSSTGFEARFYVDDKQVNTTYINQTTIKPGENITVSAGWNTTGFESGWRTVKVSVGPYNDTLNELNRGNNYASKSILVGKEKAWWKLAAVIVGIIAFMAAVALIRKIRRRR